MTTVLERRPRQLDADGAVALLERMLAIPSPSYRERALAGFLAGEMRALGMAAHVDEAGNAIGVTGRGGRPHVLLVGHLDTVAGDVPVRRAGDLLYGRGAADAKGPLAAMVAAASRLSGFPGKLVVAGAVEEETPRSRGAVHIGRTMPRPDAVIVGEPGGWDSVILGYKGKLDLRYQVHRPATHPTNPAEKATEAAAAFWRDAVAALGPRQGHGRFDTPGVTLCRMGGDLTGAELEISYRTPVGFDTERLLASLRERARGGELEVLNAVPAVLADRRDPVVRALTAAIRQTGGQPRVKVKTATSDMNTLAEFWSVPMATYGPGDSRMDHAADEHIAIPEFLRGIFVLTNALAELGRHARIREVS